MGAAVAAGLSAHLLAEPVWHRGSMNDIVLLVAAICCLKFSGLRSMPRTGFVVAAAVGAAVVAGLWPLLEPGGRFGLENLLSLLWLIPVMLTFVCSIAIFARQSLSLVRAIAAITISRTLTQPTPPSRISSNRSRSPRTILSRQFSRRGPPVLTLAATFST